MIRRPSRRRGTTQRRLPVTARTITRKVFLFCFFLFFITFQPPEKGQNTAILGPTGFFSAVHACRGVHANKKTKQGSTKKTPKISKKLSPTTSNTVNGPFNHKDLYLWHRGSIIASFLDTEGRCKRHADRCVCVYGKISLRYCLRSSTKNTIYCFEKMGSLVGTSSQEVWCVLSLTMLS